MIEEPKSFSKDLLFWKMAIFKLSGKSIVALFTSLVATLNGTQWSEFSSTGKFIAIGAALVAMLNTIDAFLSETMSDLKAKKEKETFPPFVQSDVRNP